MRFLVKAILAVVMGVCFMQAAACANLDRDRSGMRVFLTPEQAAQSALDELHKLGLTKDPSDEEFAKDLGFVSSEEVAGARLGSPLRIWNVPLDGLREFQPSSEPSTLLVDTHSIIFPILVKGEARSSFTVTGDGKSWRITEKGSPKLARKIQRQHPSSSNFLVLITPLRLQFLGDRKDGQLMLASIDETPHFKEILLGRERSAHEVFPEISPLAKNVYEQDQRIRQIMNREGARMESPRPIPDKAPMPMR